MARWKFCFDSYRIRVISRGHGLLSPSPVFAERPSSPGWAGLQAESLGFAWECWEPSLDLQWVLAGEGTLGHSWDRGGPGMISQLLRFRVARGGLLRRRLPPLPQPRTVLSLCAAGEGAERREVTFPNY